MLIYITGGARSGKSHYAQALAARLAKNVVFVATATPSDADMKRRIAQHQKDRPTHWVTIENPIDLASVFPKLSKKTQVVLVDCLTLYVSGCLVAGDIEIRIRARVEEFCKTAAASSITVILVSNEVGSGSVPTTEWGLQFQDYLGRANQIAAHYAKHMYLMVSGIPVKLKGPKNKFL